MIHKKDLVLWPNFISKQWNRYFFYSEIPHNVQTEDCPFRAVPFVGDENTRTFDVICDVDNNFKYLAKDGHVIEDDKTNREGHAAKVYFNSLFGKDFSRDNECNINKYLNYGYSIILSAVNREVKILGYLTELGVHHIGESNSFNLSST